MTCKEYQISNRVDKNDKLFMKFVKGKKFKMCPFCKFWVEKTVGCDHMRCKCGKEFCYKCGGVYRKCACVKAAQERMRRIQEQQRRRQAAKKAQAKKKPVKRPVSKGRR